VPIEERRRRRIPEGDAQTILIDGVRRQVFIKLTDSNKVTAVLQDTGDQVEYKYTTGDVSFVSLAMADIGKKRVRVANLPPEVPDETLRASLAPYRKVLDKQVEKCSIPHIHTGSQRQFITSSSTQSTWPT
jgi:hypothetical protein